MSSIEYQVMLFKSVSHALLAEKTLKSLGIPHKLIPVPRHISSDCGVCLRFSLKDQENILGSLAGKVAYEKTQPL
jgi:hypothetical protein